MKFLAKIPKLILIFSFSSCSFSNQPKVLVTIDSDPAKAKIYIDDVYYGDTTQAIGLTPNKNYNLRLMKDGYRSVNYEMETKFTMRRNRPTEAARCKLDLLTSFLLFPIAGLKSFYCRDFTKELYSFEMEPDLLGNTTVVAQPPAVPPSWRKYYTMEQSPNQIQKQSAENLDIDININQTPKLPTSKPFLFNNQSEFLNDGNESVEKNFNRKHKMDYYNWQ